MTKKTMKLKTIPETTSFNKFSEQSEEMQEDHDPNPQEDLPLEPPAERKASGDCCNPRDIPTRENTPPKQCDQKSKRKGLKLHSQPFLTRSPPTVEYCLPYNETVDQMEPTMFSVTAETPLLCLAIVNHKLLRTLPFRRGARSRPRSDPQAQPAGFRFPEKEED
jgi:hypothetical protein